MINAKLRAKKRQPLPISSEQLRKLNFLAGQYYGKSKVKIVSKNGIIDEFVAFNITHGEFTHTYHWLELALIHIPTLRYKDKRLSLFKQIVLDLPKESHIIDLLWNLKP